MPALAVSLTVAVWLLDGASAGEPLAGGDGCGPPRWSGWAWGFGYFVAGLWWLGAAFLVEADLFAWAMPLGVLGLPAVLAVFPAGGFALARALWSPGAARLFAFAFGLASSEWLRGHLFTGFPWNTLGMALGQNLWLMQAASVVGLYGLTVLTVLVCAAPATWGTGATGRERAGRRVAAALALAALAAFGALRLPSGPVPTVAGVTLRIMQPNLAQDAKFNPANRDEIMRRYLALSGRAAIPRDMAAGDVTHLIWPESAFPFLLERDARALGQIAALLPPGTTLITGAARAEEPAAGGGAPPLLQRRAGRDATTARSPRPTTRSISSRSASTCPSPSTRSCAASACASSSASPAASSRAGPAKPSPFPACRRCAATICYEAIFPGGRAARRSPAGLDPQRDQRRLVRRTRPDRGSTSPRAACGPSRRACRSSAPPTAASPRWWTLTGG